MKTPNIPAAIIAALTMTTAVHSQNLSNGADNFYKSDAVTVTKVTFANQYRMKVAGNLFTPKDLKENSKNPAIIVGHPMGAVKEQSSNLYAAKLAERGFVTLSLDLSFWGGVRGSPATRFHRISMRRISVLRLIICAAGRLFTRSASAFSESAAAAASPSAPPKSIRA
ncbi:MAG: rane protein [Verrucomicrobiales bacterium]|nr:rane protein [Verrucomicrobiales bacterium]